MVSTRSGRVIAPEPDAPVEHVQIKPKRKTSRQEQPQRSETGTAEILVEQEEVTAAEVFKTATPVKQLTPKPRSGSAPENTASSPAAAKSPHNKISPVRNGMSPAISAPMPGASPVSGLITGMRIGSPPGTCNKSTASGSVSLRNMAVSRLAEAQMVPLPADEEEATEFLDDAHTPISPLRGQTRRERGSVLGRMVKGCLILGVLVTASVLTYSIPCKGWPVRVDTPNQVQQLCTAVDPHAEEIMQKLVTAQQATQRAMHAALINGDEYLHRLIGEIQTLRQVVITNAQTYYELTHQEFVRFLKHEPEVSSQPSIALPGFAAVLPADALKSLVVQGEGFPSVQDIYEMRTQRDAAAKALGLVLTCKPETCSVALDHLRATTAHAAQSVIEVDGNAFSNSESAAGELQLLLATRLAVNSHSVVVVHSIEALDVSCFSVLNNALSEGGNLQHDGNSIPTVNALFVLVTSAGYDGNPEEHGHMAKSFLQALIESKGEVVQEENYDDSVVQRGQPRESTSAAVALALRRRIEDVLAFAQQ